MNPQGNILENPLVSHKQQGWYAESQRSLSGITTSDDLKYFDILYSKLDVTHNVNIRDMPIDFSKAEEEMKNLSVVTDKSDAFIIFVRQQTGEIFQFLKLEEDEWYADVPISPGRGWEHYVWGCRTDTKSALDTLELFFEGVSWFSLLPFTMRMHRR